MQTRFQPRAAGLAFLLMAALGWLPPARAQFDDEGAIWLAGFAQGRFGAGDRWRGWLDAQVRGRDGGGTFDAVILRPGVGYAITDRLVVHGGYALIVTRPTGQGSVTERRPWQQLTWNLPVTGFSLVSRTRLEQRRLESRSGTGLRLRQFVKATRPLGPRLFLSGFDEIFVDLNDTDWGQREGLRQNRLFAGLGIHLDDQRRNSLEVGYLNQWVDRPGTDRMSHVLSLNAFVNF